MTAFAAPSRKQASPEASWKLSRRNWHVIILAGNPFQFRSTVPRP